MHRELENAKLIEMAIVLVIAIWGGIAGYLNRVINDRRKFSFFAFASQGFIGGFTGMVAFLIADYLDLSGFVLGGIAGVGGWLGAETMTLLKSFLRIKAAKLLDGEGRMKDD
jgi:hypothetical protein